MNNKSNKLKGHRRFILQWHLTTKCNYNCYHCYMHESSYYNSESNNELDHRKCLEIIDDFDKTLQHWNIPGQINFTGGDPLLKEEVFDIIRYAREKGIYVGLLGNPDTLTRINAKKLKELGVLSYQISIDGLKKTHDMLRGKKGAFDEAIRSIHI